MALARKWNCLVYLAFAAFALATGGCLVATVGAVGGAAAGYAYYKGKVNQDFNAGFEDTLAAGRTALTELGLPVLSETRASNSAILESHSAEGDRIRIDIDSFDSPIPIEGKITRVGVRVATFGDQAFSQKVLDQIGAHLVVRPGTASPNSTPIVGPVQPSSGVVPASGTGAPPRPFPSAPAKPQTVEPPLLDPKQG
jgi:hypothetical protein